MGRGDEVSCPVYHFQLSMANRNAFEKGEKKDAKRNCSKDRIGPDLDRFLMGFLEFVFWGFFCTEIFICLHYVYPR